VETQVPFGNNDDADDFSIQGRPLQPKEHRTAYFESVNEAYFHTMRIPLIAGRLLAETDGMSQPLVAVVSERFAQRYFPGGNAIGKAIKRGQEGSKSGWTTIVGIVGDIRYEAFEKDELPEIYVPYQQVPQSASYLALRTEGDPDRFAAAARSAVAAVDPDQPLFNVMSLQKTITNQTVGFSYVAAMLAAMGIIALVLASVGVYGVMAYSVSERTHEIGVRMTLGAQRGDILRMVFGRGLMLTGIGLGIGLPLAVGLAQLLSNLIYGVSSADFATFGGVTVLMSAITLLACYLPTRRATQVDPMEALRYE
jgi:putative ABC transport system permease protein